MTAAIVTDHVAEIFLIGGDYSHRITQATLGAETAAAMGMAGGLPPGRRGDPDGDHSWYATDWMDTRSSQNILDYQRHSFPAMNAELRANVGWRHGPIRLVTPAVRWYLKHRSPYRGFARGYADPLTAISHRWGDSRPSQSASDPLVRR